MEDCIQVIPQSPGEVNAEVLRLMKNGMLVRLAEIMAFSTAQLGDVAVVRADKSEEIDAGRPFFSPQIWNATNAIG